MTASISVTSCSALGMYLCWSVMSYRLPVSGYQQIPGNWEPVTGNYFPASFSTYSSYSSASISSSTSSGEVNRTLIIQPSPYGSVFTSSGFSASASLTSTTSPETGANSSETALTDSMLPISSPCSSSLPTCGSSTNT